MTANATPPDLVIFDCDGVLVDSEPIAIRVTAAAITRLGYPISTRELRAATLGVTVADEMAMIEKWIGGPLPADWEGKVREEIHAAFRQSLQPVPGAQEVVALVQSRNISFCIASSGSLDKMELTLGLTGLRRYFGERIFSSSMVARGKPHPDLFLYAAAQMRIAPYRTVVIEDSVPGVIGARDAGMQVFAYAGDPDSNATGLAAQGGHLFHAMSDLPHLLGLD